RRGRDVPPDVLVRVARQPDPRGADPLGRTSLSGRSGEAVGSLLDRIRDAPVHDGVAPHRHHVPLPRSEPQRLGQPRGDSRGGRRRRPPATGRPRTAPFLISLAPLGWGTTPHTPRGSAYLPVARGRASRSTGVVGGSCRVLPTAHHPPLATPSLRSGWGTTPHTPRGSAYLPVARGRASRSTGVVGGSCQVSTHPPTTYHSRLPRAARLGGRPPYPPSVAAPARRPGRVSRRTRPARGSRPGPYY